MYLLNNNNDNNNIIYILFVCRSLEKIAFFFMSHLSFVIFDDVTQVSDEYT